MFLEKRREMAEESVFYGTWRIVECVSLSGTVETTGFEGTDFRLDETGDVTWTVADGVESLPFFGCETYEVCAARKSSPLDLGHPTVLKFRTFSGHNIEFRVEISDHDDLMLLTYDRCCMLQCQKVASNDTKNEFTFSFLSALDEGYFSDLVIRADSGKEYRVHRTILRLANSQLDWNRFPSPLTGLPEDVLQLVLHYLYAECLPNGLTEGVAKSCVMHVGKMPGFDRLTMLCETFIVNTALKEQIMCLVRDMHTCADHIVDHFSGKREPDSSLPPELLMKDPAKLCDVVKQSLREAAVAGAKLLILCDLFSRKKGELSRQERHEIIKYAKCRLPIFMSQLHTFLEVCKQHCNSLSAHQRHEIAAYLVPEIDTTLDAVSQFVVETKGALEQVISDVNKENVSTIPEASRKGGKLGEMLGKSLRNALHMRELMKLRSFHERVTTLVMSLLQRKENFSLMSHDQKVRSVAKNLEQLIDEVPMFLLRIEELISALDEKVQWREWKYLFKLGTSKVAWGLSKVVMHKSMLESLTRRACEMVHRGQFSQAMVALGLLEPMQKQAEVAVNNQSSVIAGSKLAARGGGDQATHQQTNIVESLMLPPLARHSTLAQHTAQLFGRNYETDMVFEVVCVQDMADVVIDHTHGEPIAAKTEREPEVSMTQIPAHRVIVAARCDWFRRALLSGMRESIDKKIIVHDTNPELFRLFLQYLYSGQVQTNDMSTEQLADMMAISDRYEVKQTRGSASRHKGKASSHTTNVCRK
ncbi:PREDICTED: uncharacterized protein LOC106807533 [Priapulus caudatus]|uniref:Uncharacterized protein LOC106807533 n=1 Tax=Priapulus caudatus TaxID=37621 RepID=A0ABM1DZL5_PRICU|nr:PREDICTED: uncharacterized protein LOC106807533 [Priapulus caudatus]